MWYEMSTYCQGMGFRAFLRLEQRGTSHESMPFGCVTAGSGSAGGMRRSLMQLTDLAESWQSHSTSA